MKPLTYLLVDFENLQPPAKDIARVRGDEYRLWVFHGPHQNKFAAEMVVAWQPLGDRVRFVQSSKTGKNALDFHIAFCLGQAQQRDAAEARAAQYIVISKDGGFDPLFDYMRSLGCAVGKAVSIPNALASATRLKPALPATGGESPRTTVGLVNHSAPTQPSTATKAAAKKAVKKSVKKAVSQSKSAVKTENVGGALKKLLAHLRTHPNNRPTTPKSLENHIPSMVGGTVTKKVIKDLMEKLVSDGIVEITGQKIVYKTSNSKK